MMKIYIFILSFMISLALSDGSYIRPMEEEEYKIIKQLVMGSFNVPVVERTRLQKSAIVKFWRLKDGLKIDEKGQLLYENRRVVKKSEIEKIVTKTFVKNKSGGHRKIQARAADGYAGISKRDVLKITNNDGKFRRFNARFTNKAVPKPVRAKKVHEIHQIDLVDMRGEAVKYKGKTFRYIMSLLDVFSRFHWLYPLETKHSRGVKEHMKNIYEVHGSPEILQSDNGKEFKGCVKRFCHKKKIEMRHSRPYNPRAQGKVERSHRVLRKKIAFDMLNQKHTGINWVKNLPNYMKCVNNEKREALGWQSPFEIYFGRKSNELVRCGVPESTKSPEIGKVSKPTDQDIENFAKQRSRLRKKAHDSDERVAKRTVEYFRKKNRCSTYKIKEKVFIRFGKTGKKAPKRRHVCAGKVIKVGKHGDSYKIEYKNPTTNCKEASWFSVEDIADFHKHKQNDKKKGYQKRLLSMIREPYDAFEDQGFFINYNPPGDGNCQFSAICKILKQFGFQRSPETLRREIVSYIEENPVDVEGFPLDLYIGMPLSQYLENMSRDGTYGDEITLRAAAELFNIEFVLISTLGRAAEVTVRPMNFSPINRAFLGHLAENHGEHYVVLGQIDDPEQVISTPDDQSIDFNVNATTSSKSFSDLPPELIEHILLAAVKNCTYVWPSHVVYTFNALRNVCQFWRIVLDAKAMSYLPRVYVSHPDILPKSKGGLIQVNMQRIIKKAGSFCGLVMEMQTILNNPKWNRAWLDLILLSHGWYTIAKIWWKAKK